MKKMPQRTCIGCNEKKDKKDFIRIVKNKENDVFYSPDFLPAIINSFILPYHKIVFSNPLAL